ncbi:hypothetical protein BC834DRAFT_186547 [Gloeopeniophorella convolvens]|nr:hypothetical protein BC834DRAFT_186547 [Gloeopeniophorella convolvens]
MSLSRLLRRVLSNPSFDRSQSPSRDQEDNMPVHSQELQERTANGRFATEPPTRVTRLWRKRENARAISNPDPPPAPTTPSSAGAPQLAEVPSVANDDLPAMPVPMLSPFTPSLFLVPSLSQTPALFPSEEILESPLSAAWNQLKAGEKNLPSESRHLAIDTAEDTVQRAQDVAALYTPVFSIAGSLVEQTGLAKAVKEGIDHFFEGMPVLMNALDEVADLHPFIGIVVMAFKTVYTLELKRRENEKKVIALYVEMKDMMAVLLQLRDIRDDKVVAPDHTSIEDRMKSLVDLTAEDIKQCSNGPLWDAKLLSFVTLFEKRRSEFQFALTVHTSLGVEGANTKLDSLGATARALDAKMNEMLAVFQSLVGPEQRQLAALVQTRGGVRVVRENEKVLRELNSIATSKSSARVITEPSRSPTKSGNVENLRDDLFEDPSAAVEKNLVVFSRKFEVQKRQIVDELTIVVKRETDRVIQEVKTGPHDRILDQSIHGIWKEMGWRGNVKARHFVLALRDYYLERVHSESKNVRGVSGVNETRDPDAWAIDFIDLGRLQPILESFDDDASGFITITEMNKFTSARPIDWSLPHWVAFWASGWKMSMIAYASKIESLFAKMAGIYSEVLPANRETVTDYVCVAWRVVHPWTAALKSEEEPDPYQERFTPYVESEEARLTKNLKAVEYVIDSVETIPLIVGEGRIEKTVLLLTYLLMKHHFEIMRMARKKVISRRELNDSEQSLQRVCECVQARMSHLGNIFRQQGLDTTDRFATFAFGLFKHYDQPNNFWTLDYLKSLSAPIAPYFDPAEDQNIQPQDILRHPFKDSLELEAWPYDGHTLDELQDVKTDGPLKEILGTWHGYYYNPEGDRENEGWDTPVTIVIQLGDGEGQLKATAWGNQRRFGVTGTYSRDPEGTLHMTLKLSYLSVDDWDVTIFFIGQYNVTLGALDGVWGGSAEVANSVGMMRFRRMHPKYLVHYPTLLELRNNKARSLWRFALSSVVDDVRRERWAWSYFAERRRRRQVFMRLGLRGFYFGNPLVGNETQDLLLTARKLQPADACFYAMRLDYIRGTTCVHGGFTCDNCGGVIGGSRIACLDCVSAPWNTVDLCDSEQCINSQAYRDDLEKPHEPTHRILKLRTHLLQRQHIETHTAATEAYDKIESLCNRLASPDVADEELDLPYKPMYLLDLNAQLRLLGPEEVRAASVPYDGQPRCANCWAGLSLPCWYCISCQESVYICNSCDAQGGVDLPHFGHAKDHYLIRCQEPSKPEVDAAEQQLTMLEQRFDGMETRFGTMETRLETMETRLETMDMRLNELSDRMGTMEGLLGKIADVILSRRPEPSQRETGDT